MQAAETFRLEAVKANARTGRAQAARYRERDREREAAQARAVARDRSFEYASGDPVANNLTAIHAKERR